MTVALTRVDPPGVRSLCLPPYRGEIVDSYALPEMLAALACPKRLMDEVGAETLAEGRNRVVAVSLRLGSLATSNLVLKEFSAFGIPKLKTLGRPSKAEKAWRGALALDRAGFETPRPVAFLEKRIRGMIEESYFVAERVSGSREIRGLFRELSADELRPLLAGLARVLFAAHEKGIFHRDLSDGNILVSVGADGFRFCFLDTNRVRFRKRIGTLTRAKNLIRLGVPLPLRSLFLAEYAAAGRRPPGRLFVFWYRLTKAAFTSWIRVKKALRLKKLARKLKVQ